MNCKLYGRDARIKFVWLFFILLVVLVASIYFFLVLPVSSKSLDFSRQNKLVREKIYFYQEAINQKEKYRESKPLLLKISKKINLSYKNTKVSELLYEAASSSNIVITDESYGIGPKGNEFVKLGMVGSYFSVKDFIGLLHDFPYLMNIEKLELNKKDNASVEVVLFLNVINSY